jgi:hypothetical protein
MCHPEAVTVNKGAVSRIRGFLNKGTVNIFIKACVHHFILLGADAGWCSFEGEDGNLVCTLKPIFDNTVPNRTGLELVIVDYWPPNDKKEGIHRSSIYFDKKGINIIYEKYAKQLVNSKAPIAILSDKAVILNKDDSTTIIDL